MSFSETLKRLLDQKSMSQAELCRHTGIPTSLMSNYVKGTKSPSLTNSLKLAKAFQISMDELSGIKIDPTVLNLDEYPIMAKYLLLTAAEQAEVELLVDSLLARRQTLHDGIQKKLTPASRDELFEKMIANPRRIAFIEQLLSFDSAALDRVEKILDIIETLPAAANSDNGIQ